MYGLEFATLYTLPHGLTRYAENLHSLEHSNISLRYVFDDLRTKLISDADPPWRSRCQLLTRDDAFVEPSVQGRRGQVQDLCGLPYIHKIAFGRLGRWLEAWDVPVLAKTIDTVRSEPETCRCPALLPIQDARDGGVVVVTCQTPEEINRIFVGAIGRLSAAPQIDVDFVDLVRRATSMSGEHCAQLAPP